ncbi:lysozyme inhibitor LprI family protein [Microbulbifer sp.]|uniref:lysozyme inhibitor LprI family protein n=1 Tax=Microbulbifer sp. TaxID=1908541 RepID=UPI003F3B7B08
MSTKYHYLLGLVAMGERGDIQEQQRKWLAERRQCGSDVRCLEAAYDDRMKKLDNIYEGLDRPL